MKAEIEREGQGRGVDKLKIWRGAATAAAAIRQ